MTVWTELDFVRDVYISICKDTGDEIEKEGADWLLNIAKKSPANTMQLRSVRMGHLATIQTTKRLEEGCPENIDVYDNQLADTGVSTLFRFSDRHSELKRLNLGGNDISSDGFMTLADHLFNNKNLEVLELGSPNGRFFPRASKCSRPNKMTPSAFSAVCNSLKSSNLRYLGLGGLEIFQGHKNDVMSLACNTLGELLESETGLTGLDLSMNSLGDVGAVSIFKGLEGNNQLQILDLTDNGLTAESIPLLSAVLSGFQCSLQQLNLSHNDLKENGAKSLAMGLFANRSLIELNIESCSLGDEGVGVVCRVLSESQSRNETKNELDESEKIFDLMNSVSLDLQQKNVEKQIVILNSSGEVTHKLDLNKSVKMQETTKNLLQSTKMNMSDSYVGREFDETEKSQIQQLNLAGNDFCLKALKYICSALLELEIKQINLAKNKIGFDGALLLAQTIMPNMDFRILLQNPLLHNQSKHKICLSQLNSINLNQTGINDEGFLILSFCFGQMDNLTSVNLENNFIGENGGREGSKYILLNKNLTQFNLNNNEVSHQVIELIENRLIENRERIMANGPQRLIRNIATLKEQIMVLPRRVEELKFDEQSNHMITQHIIKVNEEADEIYSTFDKQIKNLESQIEAAVQGTEKATQGCEKCKLENEELLEHESEEKQIQKEQVDEELHKLAEFEELFKEKEMEVNKFKNDKELLVEEYEKQVKQTELEIQKVLEVEKQSIKLIEEMKEKHSELVLRVEKSSGVMELAFGLEYEEVVGVLERMESVEQGQLEISQPTGYDGEKALAAGLEGAKKKKTGK